MNTSGVQSPAQAGTAVPVLTRGKAAKTTSGPRSHFPPWSPEEETVLAHYLDALLRGGYFLVRDAAVACLERLGQLPGGTTRRLSAVHNRLVVQAAAAGRMAYCASWSEQEETNVRHCAKALISGKYGSTREAVDDCLRQHELLRHERPTTFAPRTRLAMWQRFMKVARGLGWTGAGRQMIAVERRVYDDCVRGLVSGRYRTLSEASRVCRERLSRLQQRRPSLPLVKLSTIENRLAVRARKLGRYRAVVWTHVDDVVVERHAEALAEGRYSGNREAGRRCLAELRRLPGHRAHSLSAVTTRVAAIAARTDAPRARAHWTTAEEEIIERYAHAVLAGTYSGPAQAAGDCYRDFCRLVLQYRGEGSRPTGAGIGRSRQSVQYRLVKRVRALGRHGQPLVRWTQPEQRICDSWVRWFTENCVPGRRHPMDVACQGLRDELAEAGFSRSESACQHRLRKLRLRRLGLL